jgi:hypothetical protein
LIDRLSVYVFVRFTNRELNKLGSTDMKNVRGIKLIYIYIYIYGI